MIEAEARRGLEQGRIETGRDIPDVSLSQIIYATLLQISGEWRWVETSQFSKLGGPAFDIAQRQVTPAAAAAIGRMASRYASGDPALADKVRRQQDLSEKWNSAEKQIIAQLVRPVDRIDHDAIAADRRSQSDLERELKSLGSEIKQGSGGRAALPGDRVRRIARVQGLLAEDEGLVYFAGEDAHMHAML